MSERETPVTPAQDSPEALPKSGLSLWVLGGFAAALGLYFVAMNGPDLIAYMTGFAKGQAIPGDSFMYIPPYLTQGGELIFADDPLARFFRFAHAPQGYDLLFQFLASHMDIRQAAIVITFVIFAVTFLFTFLTGRLLAGWPGGLVALAVLLASSSLINFTTGSFPRSFGPPLAAMAIYGLCSGRLVFVVAATVLGTLFYYMIGVMSGLALLIWCFLPAGWRAGPGIGVIKRIMLVLLTGVISLGILGFSLNRDHGFGPSITPAQHETYPEASPEGRYWAEWHGLHTDLARSMADTFDKSARKSQSGGLKGAYLALDRQADTHKTAIGFVLMGCFGLAVLLLRRKELSGIAVMLLAACLLYLAAIALFPVMFFPKRFLQLTMPLITALLFAWAGRAAVLRLRPNMPAPGQMAVLLAVLSGILLATGRPPWPPAASFKPSEHKLFAYVRNLPPEAVIAGWPDDKVMDGMPYLGAHSVLLNFETHLPLRAGFADLTRARMETLITALVEGRPEAFAALHDDFGITHVLVNDSLIEGRDFKYFAPFQTRLERIGDHSAGYDLLRSGAVGPVVFEAGDMALIELAPQG